jgi:hypothetical protein
MQIQHLLTPEGQPLAPEADAIAMRYQAAQDAQDSPVTRALPGEALRKKMRSKQRKRKKPSKGGGLSVAGGGLSVAGGALSLAGGRMPPMKSILKFMESSVIPSLFQSLDINPRTVSKKVVLPALRKAIRGSKTLSALAKGATRYLLPLLGKSKMATLTGQAIRSLSGTGLDLRTMGKLASKLHGGLLKALMSLARGGMKGGALALAGGSFWSSFKKGFLSVFKPFAKIAAPVLTAVGMPEFGVPLAAVGSAL